MILRVILPIFVLLAVGFAGKKIGLLNSERVGLLNKAAFYVALPALVFHSVYTSPIAEIYSPSLILGFFLVVFSSLGLGWFIFSTVESASSRSVSIVQSYHGNMGYMGLPVVIMTLGSAAGPKASLILGLGGVVHILLTVVLLVYVNQVGADLMDELKRIISNPVLLALLIALVFSYFNLPVWDSASKVISLLGRIALPLALFGVGASIKLGRLSENLEITASVALLKTVFMPFLAMIVLLGLGVETIGLKTGVLMLGMPPAISTYIYASELGGDEELASLNISFATIVSLLTISILLVILSGV